MPHSTISLLLTVLAMSMVLSALDASGTGVRRRADNREATCPAHDPSPRTGGVTSHGLESDPW